MCAVVLHTLNGQIRGKLDGRFGDGVHGDVIDPPAGHTQTRLERFPGQPPRTERRASRSRHPLLLADREHTATITDRSSGISGRAGNTRDDH